MARVIGATTKDRNGREAPAWFERARWEEPAQRVLPAPITSRELEVLQLVADGLENREIAARLFLSAKTVGIHVSRLLRKLDARTRGEAVAVARRRGLLA